MFPQKEKLISRILHYNTSDSFEASNRRKLLKNKESII